MIYYTRRNYLGVSRYWYLNTWNVKTIAAPESPICGARGGRHLREPVPAEERGRRIVVYENVGAPTTWNPKTCKIHLEGKCKNGFLGSV